MDPKVINELLDGAQLFQKRRDLKDWQKIPRTVFLSNLALWLGLDIKEFFKEDRFDEEAFLTEAIERLKKIHEGQLPPANIPPNLEELREEWETAQREHQAFLEKEGKGLSPKEQIEIWIEKQKEIYQQRQVEKATKVTAEKIKTRAVFPVAIPPKKEKTEKEEERATEVAKRIEKLEKWVENGFVLALPSLQQNLELRHGMTAAVTRILKAYLPKLSERETEKIPFEKLEKIANNCQKAILDALALPIADQINADGLEIKALQVKKIIEDLTPNPKFPQTFDPLLPLLTLSKEERFPEEKYVRPKQVALEEVDGGLPILFLPEKVQAAVLKVLTYPLTSTITENPETAFSLIDPETGSPIREKIRQLITNKGITPISYNTLKLFTADVRSLRLLCAGITPEILLQTIEKQKEKGIKETDPVVKILRMLHDDLGKFEKQIGFPIKLVKAWARVKATISKPHQPLEVGTQEVYPTHQPEKLYQGTRARIRTEWLKQGIKKIYRLQAQAGERVRVENRFLQPLTKPIRFIYHRALQPIFIRLGKTTLGQTAKLGWGKVKGVTTKAFWTISKEGFKKAAKKGISFLVKKFAATKIGAALGTAFPVIGAAIGFVVDLGLGLLKKTVGKLFGFLKGLVSWGGKKGQRVIYGLSDFMQQMTSGEVFFDSKALKFIFILVFAFLFALGIFEVTIEPGAALITKLVPTETRYLGPPEDLPGRIPMETQELSELFQEAAEKYCIPVEIIFAISQMEASGVWGYAKDEVGKFSTPGWWDEASCKMDKKIPGDCADGYCYDTCKITGLCPGYSVVGPMQFEQGTWNGYVASLKADFEEEDDPHEPHRCNLRDSVLAAAMKVKANSGTGEKECNWSKLEDEEDIIRQTARAYCGSCGTIECEPDMAPECVEHNRACGVNYCEAVWILYNEYK